MRGSWASWWKPWSPSWWTSVPKLRNHEEASCSSRKKDDTLVWHPQPMAVCLVIVESQGSTTNLLHLPRNFSIAINNRIQDVQGYKPVEPLDKQHRVRCFWTAIGCTDEIFHVPRGFGETAKGWWLSLGSAPCCRVNFGLILQSRRTPSSSKLWGNLLQHHVHSHFSLRERITWQHSLWSTGQTRCCACVLLLLSVWQVMVHLL